IFIFRLSPRSPIFPYTTLFRSLKYEAACKNRVKVDWDNYNPPKPTFTGTKVFDNFDLEKIREYIDWQPYFIAWEMHGRFPQILRSEEHTSELQSRENLVCRLLL